MAGLPQAFYWAPPAAPWTYERLVAERRATPLPARAAPTRPPVVAIAFARPALAVIAAAPPTLSATRRDPLKV